MIRLDPLEPVDSFPSGRWENFRGAAKMTTKHTPTPWYQDEITGEDEIEITALSRVDFIEIAKLQTGYDAKIGKEQIANAALIVRAVNSHEELTSSLQAMVILTEAWMNGALRQMGVQWESEANHPPALRAARAILAKATS